MMTAIGIYNNYQSQSSESWEMYQAFSCQNIIFLSLGEGLIFKKQHGSFSTLISAKKKSWITFYSVIFPTLRQNKVMVKRSYSGKKKKKKGNI